MLQDFFEHTINKVYQNCRALVFLFLPPIGITSSYIKFGGWEISYNWKGKVRPSQEVVGNVRVIAKTMFFNHKYALQLMGIDSGESFSFPNFVRTIAHEVAHCLLLDYDSKYLTTDNPHNELHGMLTGQLEWYLWTLPEIEELARLQGQQNDLNLLC